MVVRVCGVLGLAAMTACGGEELAPSGVGGASVVSAEAAAEASTGTAAGGGETSTGGGAPAPDGSWEHPFVVDALPFTAVGDTTDAPARADAYWPCAPETDEGGGEIVYAVDVPASGWLDVEVDDVPGDAVDLDVHLLAAADPAACVTRHDRWLGSPVQPRRYWIVVDTWVSDGEARPGPYTLDVRLTTEGDAACLESPVACDGMLPPFVNWDVEEAPGDAGCLPGMVRVDDFCVDRYEAFVIELIGDDWGPISPYAPPSSAATLMALSVEGAVPQGHIDQVQAAEACLMAGKRLCADAEWLRACQGPAGHPYPYGDTLVAGACNEARTCHPVVQYFESGESWVWSELGHPCIGQLPEGLAPTGDFSTCVSAEGAFDMMGNLHEWTADPAGTFRGGFYVDTVINGAGCGYATTAHSVGHHDYSTGFRCCADAL